MRVVQGLLWLPCIVVANAQLAAAANAKPALQPGSQLRLYPRSHVDEASCLARYPLHSVRVLGARPQSDALAQCKLLPMSLCRACCRVVYAYLACWHPASQHAPCCLAWLNCPSLVCTAAGDSKPQRQCPGRHAFAGMPLMHRTSQLYRTSSHFACQQVPLAMDSLGYHIVVVLPPLDIRLLRVELLPTAGPKQSAVAQLTVVRELSIMSVGSQLTVRHHANLSFKCHWRHSRSRHGNGGAGSHVVILQCSGQLYFPAEQMRCCACGAGHCAGSPARQ